MATNPSSPNPDAQESNLLRVGDRVRHATFGEGLVLEVSSHGDDLMIKVSFSSDGSQRRLLSRLANLERIGADEAAGS